MTSTPLAADLAAPAVRRRIGRRNRYLNGLLSPRGLTGAALLIMVALIGSVGPLVIEHDPYTQTMLALSPPTSTHPLGTDELGRDNLARLVSGIQVDLSLAFVAVPIAAVVGTLLGIMTAVSRFVGGSIQTVLDFMIAFPGIILGVVIGIALTPGWTAIMITIVLLSLPVFGRQSRISTLTILSLDYVSAAKTLGTPRRRIVLRHLLPNIVDSILVRAAIVIAHAVFIEGGLAIIGLGIRPPTPSLGVMISTGSQYLSQSPIYAFAPVVMVFAISFGATLLADALNKAVLQS